MPRDASETRQRILDAAQSLVLERGYAATSVDLVLARVGLTKGAFFHHFKTKEEMALALVDRFAKMERALIEDLASRASRLSADPAQQVLLIVRLLAELFDAPLEEQPGCLFASFCYESGVVSPEVLALCRGFLEDWRRVFRERLERVPGRAALEERIGPMDALADLPMAVIEGAFVIARARGDVREVAAQLRVAANLMEQVLVRVEPQAVVRRKTKARR